MRARTQLERQHVNSTCIRSIGYSESESILDIEFSTGSVYRYFSVPLDVYSALCAAPSKGAFVAQRIRSDYDFRRMR